MVVDEVMLFSSRALVLARETRSFPNVNELAIPKGIILMYHRKVIAITPQIIPQFQYRSRGVGGVS